MFSAPGSEGVSTEGGLSHHRIQAGDDSFVTLFWKKKEKKRITSLFFPVNQDVIRSFQVEGNLKSRQGTLELKCFSKFIQHALSVGANPVDSEGNDPDDSFVLLVSGAIAQTGNDRGTIF